MEYFCFDCIFLCFLLNLQCALLMMNIFIIDVDMSWTSYLFHYTCVFIVVQVKMKIVFSA